MKPDRVRAGCVSLWGIPLIPLVSRYGYKRRAAAGGAIGSVIGVQFVVGVLQGGSVAEWLACSTQAQKGLGSNRSRDAVG